MVKKKYIAPNVITAGNMFLGYLSIIESIKGNYNLAIWFIILAMIFDGLDGQTARRLDAFSEFGKEFDSFCDAISFGLAPSLLVYSILIQKTADSIFILPISFLYALCGIMRLVKFNIVNVASSEKGDFSGMPIPNGASMVCSYYLICDTIQKHFDVNFFDVYTFMTITIIAAMLMVSTVPFKTPDKTFGFIKNKKIMVAIVIILLIFLRYTLFVFTFAYVVINLFYFLTKRFANEDEELDTYIIIKEDEEEDEEEN